MRNTINILVFPGTDRDNAHVCDGCCGLPEYVGGQAEGSTPGYGDDACEACDLPDWEPDEPESED